MGKVGIFKLAKLLKQKERKRIKLEVCPHCGKPSWWLNPYTNEHECMNTKSCPTNIKEHL